MFHLSLVILPPLVYEVCVPLTPHQLLVCLAFQPFFLGSFLLLGLYFIFLDLASCLFLDGFVWVTFLVF